MRKAFILSLIAAMFTPTAANADNDGKKWRIEANFAT